MSTSSDRRVDITENGSTGSVVYRESAGGVSFYWEFGGGDVVAILQVEDRAALKAAWIGDRRTEILRFVADEVIRQKAPSCQAEIDDTTGEIMLRQGIAGTSKAAAPTMTPQAKAEGFVRRYIKLKAMVGIGVLVVALIIGGMMWFGKKVLTVSPKSGVPLGECVRTDRHIASLIQSTDPHLPNWSGRGGNETTSISIVLIPLDGSRPEVVPVISGLSSNEYSLAHIMGSDGRTLWFDVNGVGGVDLKTLDLLKPSEVRDPYVPESAWPFAISVGEYLSAGFHTSPNIWLGLHSAAELEREFALKKFVHRVVRQDDAKQERRFHRGVLDAPVDDKYYRILSMTPIGNSEFFNAAFLRMDDTSEPVRLSDPDGTLMIYTSASGFGGTTMIARVDTEGTILWKVNTGIERFKLSQILPGNKSFAFVGTRPPIPDKLSEPLVVIVENSTGKMVTHSLWR